MNPYIVFLSLCLTGFFAGCSQNRELVFVSESVCDEERRFVGHVCISVKPLVISDDFERERIAFFSNAGNAGVPTKVVGEIFPAGSRFRVIGVVSSSGRINALRFFEIIPVEQPDSVVRVLANNLVLEWGYLFVPKPD